MIQAETSVCVFLTNEYMASRKFHQHYTNSWRIWVEKYVHIFLTTDSQYLQKTSESIFHTDAEYRWKTRSVSSSVQNVGADYCQHLWSYISSMRRSVSSPDKTPRRELKIRRVAEYFWRTSRCFIWWWNTVSNAWYYFSNKMILEG